MKDNYLLFKNEDIKKPYSDVIANLKSNGVLPSPMQDSKYDDTPGAIWAFPIINLDFPEEIFQRDSKLKGSGGLLVKIAEDVEIPGLEIHTNMHGITNTIYTAYKSEIQPLDLSNATFYDLLEF